jgi:hypothetical protein
LARVKYPNLKEQYGYQHPKFFDTCPAYRYWGPTVIVIFFRRNRWARVLGARRTESFPGIGRLFWLGVSVQTWPGMSPTFCSTSDSWSWSSERWRGLPAFGRWEQDGHATCVDEYQSSRWDTGAWKERPEVHAISKCQRQG